jgi:hypothetical protein
MLIRLSSLDRLRQSNPFRSNTFMESLTVAFDKLNSRANAVIVLRRSL